MIVEFIGSTGAGKTTLFSEVQGRLARQAPAVTSSFELVAGRLGLQTATHPTVRNVIQDLAGLPYSIGSLPRHRAFMAFALKALARHTGCTVFALNYLRSILRKIGTYEVARRHPHDRIILVDEGTVLAAHLLFVFSRTGYHREEIEQFARLVPLPEFVVYVKAPVDCLVQRALRRHDVRREMRARHRAVVETYVSRATALFDRLVETNPLRDRVLTVENPDFTAAERGALADRIAEAILRFGSRTS